MCPLRCREGPEAVRWRAPRPAHPERPRRSARAGPARCCTATSRAQLAQAPTSPADFLDGLLAHLPDQYRRATVSLADSPVELRAVGISIYELAPMDRHPLPEI